MIKFFVGQRVRIVGCANSQMSHHVGKEGRLLARSVRHIGSWYVDTAPVARNGKKCSWGENHLEPILPDGHRSGDYTLSELLDRCKQGEGVPA
jgi:hypothetical protein